MLLYDNMNSMIFVAVKQMQLIDYFLKSFLNGLTVTGLLSTHNNHPQSANRLIYLGKGHFLTNLSNQVFWKKVLFMSAKWHRPSLRGHDSVMMRHTNIFEQTCPFEWDGSLDNFQGPRCFLPAFSAFIKVRNCWLGLHVDQIAEMVCIWDHISHKRSHFPDKGPKW